MGGTEDSHIKVPIIPIAPWEEGIDDRTKGLYNKYKVIRRDGSTDPGGKHEDCEYFVLDLDHDPFAAVTLATYAMACREKYPQLAIDLDQKALEIEQRLKEKEDENTG